MLNQTRTNSSSTATNGIANYEVSSGKRMECSLSRKGPRSEIMSKEAVSEAELGRERLKRHRSEMAGRVWVPDMWGQESLLKDWVDCSAFDSSLVPKGVVSARQALVEECRRVNSGGLTIENRC